MLIGTSHEKLTHSSTLDQRTRETTTRSWLSHTPHVSYLLRTPTFAWTDGRMEERERTVLQSSREQESII